MCGSWASWRRSNLLVLIFLGVFKKIRVQLGGGGGGYWKMTQNVTVGEGGLELNTWQILSTRYLERIWFRTNFFFKKMIYVKYKSKISFTFLNFWVSRGGGGVLDFYTYFLKGLLENDTDCNKGRGGLKWSKNLTRIF
jgi:hypothetical protein